MTYLVREQVRGGHEVTVGYVHAAPGYEQVPEVRWHRLRARGNYDPFLLGRILKLVASWRPVIIQTWILQMDVFGGTAALASRTPWVCREPLSPEYYQASWKTRLRVGLVRRADALVSNSNTGDRHWRRLGLRIPTYVIPNALPLSGIDAAPVLSPEQAGLQPGERLILYAGRLDIEQKNLINMVDALAAVVREQPARVILCGEGHNRPEVEARIAAAGLSDRIVLAGHVDNVWSYMKLADVFVSVSRTEGRPNAVMEAMACSCPVVVSDIEPHDEFLNDSNARLVPTDDVAAIADGIRASLDDAAGAERRAHAARELAQTWSSRGMATAYEGVYADCLTRRGMRSS